MKDTLLRAQRRCDAIFIFCACAAMLVGMTSIRFGNEPLMKSALIFGVTAVAMRLCSIVYGRLLRVHH